MKKIKRVLFVILVLMFGENSQAQHIFSETIGDCFTTSFCLDCGSPKVIVPADFIVNLQSNIRPELLHKISGEIKVQFIVDILGNMCVYSVDNQTNVETAKLNLTEAAKSLKRWEPAIERGLPVFSTIALSLKFSNGFILAERIKF